MYIHAQFLCSILTLSRNRDLALQRECPACTHCTVVHAHAQSYVAQCPVSGKGKYSLVIMNIPVYDIIHMFYSTTCFIYMHDNMSTIIQYVISFYDI